MSKHGPSKGPFDASLDIELCSICEMCARKCPTAALTLTTGGGREQLVFEFGRCNACNGDVVCQALCPEKAITIVEAPGGAVPARRVLTEGELSCCRDCGLPFIPRKKLETLLRQAKVGEKEIQHFCADCRRKRIVETYFIPDVEGT